jgi:nucleotide-binding universal stress UspA family protein
MAYMTVSTVVTDLAVDTAALDVAIDLARREGGHLDVLCLGIDPTQPDFYYAGANAVAIQTSLAEASARASSLEKSVKERLDGSSVSWAAYAVTAQMPGLAQVIAHNLRLSDIAVLPRPYGEGRGHEHEAIVEAVLFDTGIPVLVVPDGGVLANPIESVVIAWNESSEALTAVRAALPLLKAADEVNITIIDPPPHAPDRSDPGGALSQMLSRHGVKADVSVLAKTLPRVSDVIARQLLDRDADLLVMGAYGHSRIRESILGGATRNMLQIAEVPVLMAH